MARQGAAPRPDHPGGSADADGLPVVNSGYRLVAWGTMPLGATAGGLLAQALGLRAVFVIMALLMLTRVAGMTTVTNKRMDADERDAEHSQP